MLSIATAPLLRARSLDDVAHGFTTRAGGVSGAPYDGLNLGRRPGETDAALLENWRRVARALDPRLDAGDVALVEQVHGREVVLVERARGPLAPLGKADALVTTTPGVVLAARAADCVPLLLAAPGGVAAVHAGWRGCAQDVTLAALALLLARTGARAADVRVAIGPHIGPDAFEVGDEVIRGIEAAGVPRAVFVREGARPRVDLAAALEARLASAGVTRIERVGGCTTRDPALWSHRRDGERGGRQAGVIALR
jgi:polyphenol oxidase